MLASQAAIFQIVDSREFNLALSLLRHFVRTILYRMILRVRFLFLTVAKVLDVHGCLKDIPLQMLPHVLKKTLLSKFQHNCPEIYQVLVKEFDFKRFWAMSKNTGSVN